MMGYSPPNCGIEPNEGAAAAAQPDCSGIEG